MKLRVDLDRLAALETAAVTEPMTMKETSKTKDVESFMVDDNGQESLIVMLLLCCERFCVDLILRRKASNVERPLAFGRLS